MLAKKVMRNGIGLNSRIKEQMVIYCDWKSMAMEIDEDEVHEIVEAAWNDLIDSLFYFTSILWIVSSFIIHHHSIRMKRNLEEIIMANNNADQREILRLRYLYGATWAAIADELKDTVEWVKEQHKKALKKIHIEVSGCDEDDDCYAEEE